MAIALLATPIFAEDEQGLPELERDQSSIQQEDASAIKPSKKEEKNTPIPLYLERYRFHQTSNVNALCKFLGLGATAQKVTVKKWHEADWYRVGDYFFNKTMATINARGTIHLSKFPRTQLNYIASISCAPEEEKDPKTYLYEIAQILISHHYEVDYAELAKLEIAPALVPRALEFFTTYAEKKYRAEGSASTNWQISDRLIPSSFATLNQFKQHHYDIAIATMKTNAPLRIAQIPLLP
jgi:hypothetical protein